MTFALIHGAGDGAWYWHLLVAELRQRGHDAVAMDLPSDDDAAGLPEYADAVVAAVGDHFGLVVVGQSFGGFTAPLVCDRVPVELLVLVAGMIPAPGEPPQDWWANTRYEAANDASATDEEEDVIATYYHDVPPELAAEALARERPQSGTPMRKPWPREAWPDVPTRIPRNCAGRDRGRPRPPVHPARRAGRPPGGVPGRVVRGSHNALAWKPCGHSTAGHARSCWSKGSATSARSRHWLGAVVGVSTPSASRSCRSEVRRPSETSWLGWAVGSSTSSWRASVTPPWGATSSAVSSGPASAPIPLAPRWSDSASTCASKTWRTS